MNTKTTMTMVIALVAMISMTGFAAAMDTNVQYNGDGAYVCNYDAYGTGSIGIHTYTSDGSDHLISGWTNTKASGWQQMDTYSGTHQNSGIDYSGTAIVRTATVGGVDAGEDEAGYIKTITTDGEGNLIISYADYHDNHGYGSHVTTEQTVVVGSLVNIGTTQYNVTGVIAETKISGFAYGSNTTVSGMVMTKTGDDYTYVLLAMDNGEMNLYVLSGAGSIDPAVTVPNYPWLGQLAGVTLDGACGQLIEADADGMGVFTVRAGTDMHGADFTMYENGMVNHTAFDSHGFDVNMTAWTTFNGDFTADGFVYAVDLT